MDATFGSRKGTKIHIAMQVTNKPGMGWRAPNQQELQRMASWKKMGSLSKRMPTCTLTQQCTLSFPSCSTRASIQHTLSSEDGVLEDDGLAIRARAYVYTCPTMYSIFPEL